MTSPPLETSPLTGPVLVVGAGMLGTSIGLGLRRAGIDVLLDDVRPEHVRTASGLGAGQAWRGFSNDSSSSDVQLVVVAVPPMELGRQIVSALARGACVVTDVGSVKGAPLAEVSEAVSEEVLARYVGSHPLAGSERSGPLAASAALFDGRPWAVTPHASAAPDAVALVTALARACGATPIELSPLEHDAAVARTSHLPHLLAALTAGRLADAPDTHLALVGQGVRDVTRIAAGDPRLWEQIITANADALTTLLSDVRGQLDVLLAAVRSGERRVIGEVLEAGVAGRAAIPGKHGGAPEPTASVLVAVPDSPGVLARLFADADTAGVNIEDVRIDHDLSRPGGLVELTVAIDRVGHLQESLVARGWATHR